MAKCKCGSRPRIVSSIVSSMKAKGKCCFDVCAHPMYGEPDKLGIMAPVIYDEIGINLCTTIDITPSIGTTYPTATNARLKVVNVNYEYSDDGVIINNITGRPNCYVVRLQNLTAQFAMTLYDNACTPITTLYPTAVYLPGETTSPFYDEETNPNGVELEIFAPYGLSYTVPAAPNNPSPIINNIDFAVGSNSITQGLNLYSQAKILDLDTGNSTITVGLTLILQSLYFNGYHIPHAGKIDTPKGSILPVNDSACREFVAGKLLDLEIKPLDLSNACMAELMKEDCKDGESCGCNCVGGAPGGTEGAADDTNPVV